MASSTHSVCPSCGARLAPGATRCDLCGTPIPNENEDPQAEDHPADAKASTNSPTPEPPQAAGENTSDTPPVPSTSDPARGVYCNQCGWKNPPDAKYCSRCGTKLQEGVTSAPVTPPPGTRPAQLPETATSAVAPASSGETVKSSDPETERTDAAHADAEEAERKAVSRQVGIIVGAGALLVIVLFMISAVSSTTTPTASQDDAGAATTQTTPATPNTPPSVNEDPLPAQLAGQAEQLRSQIEAATGPEREQLLTDLVQLLASAGRLDLAATEQQRLAELQNTAMAWRHAGNLYYDWMMTVEDQARRAEIAQQSITAYREVVAMEPENLDARTDMAVAYLNTNNPMQGVEEITAVLDQDSTHVPARFNYGVMLAMIGRTEQAQRQFRLVQEIVSDPESPYHQRAEEALQTMQDTPSGTS